MREFFEKNRNTLFRYWHRKRMWTPYDMEVKDPYQMDYLDDECSYGYIVEVVDLGYDWLIGVADQPVTVGIRPEGFILDDFGPLTCKLNNVEVMGRDVSIVTTNDASLNPIVRSIVDADNKVGVKETVHYTLKPHKVFLFNYTDETRIHFEVK